MLTWALDSPVTRTAPLRGIVGAMKLKIMSQILLLIIERGVCLSYGKLGGNLMARKTFMAIHTYHDEKTKNEFLSDMPTTERTDVEWKEIYTFEKCQCKATWVGTDDFFFCQWEAETSEDILTTLTERGFDEYIFTALYPILMHIDTNQVTGRNPYKDFIGWDTK